MTERQLIANIEKKLIRIAKLFTELIASYEQSQNDEACLYDDKLLLRC